MIKKIKIKIVLFETIALIFIIHGLQRLYVASQGAKYDALMNENWEKFEYLTNLTAGQFLANRGIWTFGILITGVLVIGFLNWKKKINIINSILLFLLIIGIAPTGFYMKGIVNNYLNYFSGLFGEKYGISFFIGGTILTLIGITILWMTLSKYKKQYTQHQL
ncbi:MAG: hypothetical protein WDZ45_14580 [Flavobacteriaceae bacterium]